MRAVTSRRSCTNSPKPVFSRAAGGETRGVEMSRSSSARSLAHSSAVASRCMRSVSDSILRSRARRWAPPTATSKTTCSSRGARSTYRRCLEEGEVVCTKNKAGTEVEVSPQLGAGNFFGELALLNDDKRQASVKATTAEVECLTIDRKTFKRMLGPLEEILKGQEYTP